MSLLELLREVAVRSAGTDRALRALDSCPVDPQEIDRLGEAIWAVAESMRAVERGVTELLLRANEDTFARLAGRSARSELLRVNVGGGPTEVAGWLNIDLRGAAVSWDVSRGLPIPTASCSHLYCSHVLEHLEFPDQVSGLLDECRRVLVPQGRLRLVVPDVAQVLRAYVAGDRSSLEELWEWREPSASTPSLELVLHYIGARAGHDHDSPDAHRYGYDLEVLAAALERAGFVEVERADYMAGRDRSLLLDAQSPNARRGGGRFSLFVEAQAPAEG